MRVRCCLLVALGLVMTDETTLAQGNEKQELLELRYTVVNLLDSLVQRGILTADDASQLVSDAQGDAETQAREEAAAGSALREGDVRVTYVPEIVRRQIADDLRDELSGDVVTAVKAEAREEGWGVPAALPDWLDSVSLSADLRLRAQGAFFGPENARNTYLDFDAVNDAGGIDLAGVDALVNTTEDRLRGAARARIRLHADLAESLQASLRLATGDLDTPTTQNAFFGNYNRRWDTTVDRAWLRWRPRGAGPLRQEITFGRMDVPWGGTDILWDNDVSLSGLHLGIANRGFKDGGGLYLGAGYFPVKETALTTDDGWLAGAELRGRLGLGANARFELAAGYHHYENITGIRNAPESRLTDYTAPANLQRGNTLFDIRNDLDPATNLFALAAEYRIVNITGRLTIDFPVGQQFRIVTDYLRNVGYDEEDVLARTGLDVPERTEGYLAALELGPAEPRRRGDWAVGAEYRYLQRDAVVDAFTDSNFGLGGTDTQGYVIRTSYALLDDVWLRLRWFSSNEIDGPPLAIDVLQLDLNARF